MPESHPIETKARAFFLFLKGYDQGAIAAACGVTTRTLRTWIKDGDWKNNQRHMEALMQGVVMAELARDFFKFEKDLERVTMADVRKRKGEG